MARKCMFTTSWDYASLDVDDYETPLVPFGHRGRSGRSEAPIPNERGTPMMGEKETHFSHNAHDPRRADFLYDRSALLICIVSK